MSGIVARAHDFPTWERLAAPLGLIGRAMLSCVFLVEGAGKIAAYGAVADYMSQNGVDPRLLPLVVSPNAAAALWCCSGYSRAARRSRWRDSAC